MSRVALVVTYYGHDYHGWQFQRPDVPTIQRDLQQALSVVADAEVTVHCAGRTDAGVHATKQIVHFDSPGERPLKAWVMGSNAHLPDDISVEWAGETSAEFDARRSAVARRYLYVIHNTRVRSALMPGYVTQEHRDLDAGDMHRAAQHLLGENDFTSFRAANCQATTPTRNLHEVTVRRIGDLVSIDIVANAFLHHMVRNIAGVLLDIGAGQKPVSWSRELLGLRDRTIASPTAAPNGLYLIDVSYPEKYGIPEGPGLPHFMQLLAPSTLVISTGA